MHAKTYMHTKHICIHQFLTKDQFLITYNIVRDPSTECTSGLCIGTFLNFGCIVL